MNEESKNIIHPTKLNLGCGTCKLEGYLNVDIDPDVKPDMEMNICAFFPFSADYFEEVLFLHTIEHIEKRFHPTIFTEIHRVLGRGGRFILGFPEFAICAKNWIDNHRGKRDFWEATIFGRQLSKSDFHVALMDSAEVKDTLLSVGFDNIKVNEEPFNNYYTVITAIKGTPRITYEQHIKNEIFSVA